MVEERHWEEVERERGMAIGNQCHMTYFFPTKLSGENELVCRMTKGGGGAKRVPEEDGRGRREVDR